MALGDPQHREGLLDRFSGSASKEALKETFVTVATATLPIWFFPLVAVFLNGPTSSLHLLDHSVSNGELFLLCTSLVGPIIYTLFKSYEPIENQNSRLKYKISFAFPYGLSFAALTTFVCLISASTFGFQKINPNFIDIQINRSGYLTLSIVLSIIAITGFFLSLFFRNELEKYSPSELMRSDENEFSAQFQREK